MWRFVTAPKKKKNKVSIVNKCWGSCWWWRVGSYDPTQEQKWRSFYDPVGGSGGVGGRWTGRQAVDSGEGCFLFVAVITALAVWLLAALNQLLFVAVCKSHAPRFVSNESRFSLGRTATPGNHRSAAHRSGTIVTLEDLKLNAPTGKPPLPPRREQPPPEKGQSLSLSSFSGSTGSLSGSGSGRKSGNTTRLTGAALARHKLKMSLKRGGPPPAASSGSGVMTTSLDQQVQKSRGAKK
ncbi:uncharacterized protein [Drosophila bipectinata]|uniref:uncharacterized protein n=1 Tax=Drosophila bipectinata TaxID=42026 RepID=UPI0038B282B5